MVNNNVGAVTASIKLDTEQFEKAVKKLKGEVDSIKQSFSQKTSGKGLTEEVTKLKEEIDSLRKKTDSYKTTIGNLREENAEYAKTVANLKKELNDVKKSQDNFNKGLKEEQTKLDSLTNSAKKYAREVVKFKGIGFKPNFKINSEINSQTTLEGMKSAYNIYDSFVKESARKEVETWKTRQSAMRNALETFVSGTRQMAIEQRKSFGSEGGYNNYLKTLSKVRGEFEKVNNVNFTKLSGNIYKNGQLVLNWGKSFTTVQSEIKNATTLIRTELKEVDGEMQKITITVGRVTDVLKTFDYQLLSTADAETKAYEKTLQLSSAMHKMNAQGTSNWSGRQTVGGYSNYVSQVSNIVKKQQEETQRLRIATNELGTAYKSNIPNLNTYKSNINQINQALEKQRLRTAQLQAAQQSLYYKNAPNNLNTYKMNMDKINQSLEKQTGNYRKNTQEIKRGQMSMREFGTQMGAAEAYSNNLYRGLQKVRSVIVSMKTIMGAMGGMAVWNFAFELVDKAKETYNAKNEMESLLNQNSHVNAEGIQYFNKELDNTISQFQKINKYSLGETAASIGLEFDLNAKEMAKSLKVIGMIQSEYVRAGRTTEEAALAVKDILQGEFMRLSRETGVGKEELMDYGWNGDNKDVKSLMEALRKAAKDRHWDLFAEKATSLNDVIAITQNRFGEFGADLLTNVEPVIVGVFNGILGAVDKLKAGFSNMGTFGKYFTIASTGATAFMGISTALMMFKRNMGLAQIATMGWGKSFATALLGLNKTDVAMHGFWKTLTATISGTKAAEVANVGLGKSLMARLLGVKANIAGEEGFLKAIMVSQGALRGESSVMTLTAASGLNLSQKLAAVTNNLSATEVQGMKTATAIRKIVTSTKLLRIAFVGLGTIGIAAWFASVAQWADTVKQRVDAYKDVLSNGKHDIKEATDTLEDYNDKLSKLSTSDASYALTKKNRDTAKHNVADLQLSLKLAKQIKKEDKKISEQHDLTNKGILNDIYSANGVKNVEEYGQKYQQIKQAAYDIKKSEEERNKFEYASLQHINEHVSQMKEAGLAEEDRVKYITEYSTKAEEAAENLKKFNQGDINAGAYYVLNRFQLLWIDLWNDKHFLQFWDSVKKTWDDILPTLKTLWGYLVNLGHGLMDFFSTDVGRWVGFITALGTGIGLVSLKIGKWVTGSKSVFEVLKTVGGKLKEVADGWKKVAENADEANKKTGGTLPEKSTGGIQGGVEKGKFWETVGQDARNTGRTMFKYGGYIAAAMFLVFETIVLLNAPMLALAGTGALFQQVEPQVRSGIEGLKLIAPTVIALMIPILALTYVVSKFNIESSTIWTGFGRAASAIAAGMLLVAESVILLVAPLGAIAALGWVRGLLGDSVNQGKEAIKEVTDALTSLYPIIPVFVAAIVMGAVTVFTEGIGGLVIAASIAAGMLLVSEAVVSLAMPLMAIGALGAVFQDLEAVKRGTEAIKATAEAMTYVEQAVGLMALVQWELIANNIGQIINNFTGVSLSDLTVEGGFFDQLSTFIVDFNKIEIEQIDQTKVATLGTAGEGIGTIGTAMEKVKTAMDNLPEQFKNNNTNTTSVGSELGIINNQGINVTSTQSTSGYFDTFKEPLRQLKTFVYEFNHGEDFNIEQIDPTRVANISSSADMIETVNQAVEKVKTVMGNIGDSGHAAAYASGGMLSAFGYDLFHMTGEGSINNGQSSGDYKSSLGSQLKQMEDVVSDIFTFQNNISAMTGGEGENANVNGAAAMVTSIQQAISELSQSLANAIPEFEGKGNAISQAIIRGIQNGMNNLGGDITTKVAQAIDAAKPTAETYGKGLGNKVHNGFQTELKLKEVMDTEISNTLTALDGKEQEFYDKGYKLGDAFQRGYKDGGGINSPGYAAQAMQGEIGYMTDYLNQGITNLPNLAFQLGNAISSQFNVDFNLSNLQFPDISQWTTKLGSIPSMVSNVKSQVATNFNNMGTSVTTSLQGIATNAKSKYTQIVTNTRTSLGNMRSATVKNIGNIKTSWRGMQDALIASADHIKTQTSQKINKLKSNMGDFWNKIKHPDQLIAGGVAGGKPTGSIPRRYKPHTKSYAGSPILFKPQISKQAPDDDYSSYFDCLLKSGKPCYAGWNFNWTNKIKDKFTGWNTHFNKYNLDSHLNVGKFNNSNFPVKGRADVFKDYIKDVIGATTYEFYYNSKYGSPAEALRAGHFNCWDGTQIILALANAFGLSGSQGHGTWNGIGHVFARIAGIGVIDPTAIQGGYGFRSPKVKGYSAGSPSRKSNVPSGDTYNNEVHVHIDGPVYGVDDLDRRIQEGAEKASNRLMRKKFTNSLSGV